MLMWHFENIPEDERANVRELAESQQWQALVEVYNQYNVSPERLTACCGFSQLMLWTQWAISTDKI